MANSDGDESPSDTQPGEDVALDEIPLHSTNLLTVLDESGVIQYESPSIERIFGYDQDELVGEQVAEYFHPEDRKEVVEAFRTVVTTEEERVETVEYRHKQADESYCWVESVASTDPTPAGYYVINTRDITEQKAREHELVQTNKRLDEFAKVLSHDLRNPLQIARGRLELAETHGDHEHLPEIDRAHERIETLIDELLTLTQTGEIASNLEPVEPASVVTTCWRNVETGNATVESDTDRVIRANSSQLKQLLENLFRNAVEHGGDDVAVTVGDLDDGFYVEDNGPGIPVEDHEHAFEAGYSTAADGTGLGLHIVKQVVETHEWKIRIIDGDGGGSRFEITGVEFDHG